MSTVLLRRVVGVLLGAAVIVAGSLPSGFGATPAHAADAIVATVTAYGAPDGVFVEWTPQDGFNRSWRLTRTVAGASTTIDLVGRNYVDTSVLPGESATYEVAQRFDTTVGPSSNAATATRDLASWTAPEDARTVVLSGYETAQGTPNPSRLVDPPALQLRWDGKTAVGYPGDPAFSRPPGPGTYALRTNPADGELGFDTWCATGTPSGQIVVHDMVYGASGIPLQLGADLSWSCGDGPTWREHLRYNSPTPLAQVMLEAVSTKPSVVRGRSVTTQWRLHNLGNGPATVGHVQVLSTYDPIAVAVSPGCDGTVIGAEASCPLTITFTTSAQSDPVSDFPVNLSATFDGLPGAQMTVPVQVYRELVAPTVKVVARASNAVALELSVPNASDMQPLTTLGVERQVNGGAWTKIADVDPVDEYASWTDWTVAGANSVAYRAKVVATNGESSGVSAPVAATVPQTSLISGETYFAGYGDPADPAWLDYPTPAGGYIATGVAVSPDRAHLAMATYNGVDNTARLYLTDVDGGHPVELARRTDGAAEIHRLHFSPDGKQLVYTDGHGLGETIAVVDIATRGVSHLRSQGVPYGWSADGKSLLVGGGDTGSVPPGPGVRWVKVPVRPSAVQDWTSPVESWTPVPGTATVKDDNFTTFTTVTVSRTGEIVWVAPSGTSNAKALYRVPAVGGTPAVLWAPQACDLGEPVFAPSGTELSIGAGGTGCAWSGGTHALTVPTSGLATFARRLTKFAPRTVAWLTTGDTAPTARAVVPAVTSSAALVRLDSSSDPDDAVGGLTYVCSLDGGPAQACGPTWQLNGLAAGSHTVTVIAKDPSGKTSSPAATTWTVDATAPAVSLAALPATLLGPSVTLGWTAKDTGGSAVKSYDVRTRYATPGGSFSTYVYPAAWQGRTTTALPASLTQGNTYCFSVRARDAVGNIGAFTAERCTKVALDDRSLTTHGGTRGTSKSYLYGTYTRITGTSQYVSKTSVMARQIGLVVTTCNACAPLDVWIGGVKLGRVSTYSASTKVRQVKWLPLSASTRSGTVVVRPASTRSAYVDGLVIQK